MPRYATHGVGKRREMARGKVSAGAGVLEAVVWSSVHALCWRVVMEIGLQRHLGEIDNGCTT